MADGKTRKTGQHDPQLVRALADVADAKELVAELAKRVERLEAEIALLRNQLAPGSRRGPPPLPREEAVPAQGEPKRRNTEKFIDVSAIAELVEGQSLPPPRRK